MDVLETKGYGGMIKPNYKTYEAQAALLIDGLRALAINVVNLTAFEGSNPSQAGDLVFF